MSEIGYKFITSDMKSKHGNLTWKKGKWNVHKGELKLCEAGLHACETPLQSLPYAYGDKWFMVEYEGKILKDEDKFCAERMRLIKEIPIKEVVVPFVAAVARHVLNFYEKKYPTDNRPRLAIEAAEKYIKNPTQKNKDAASYAASYAAHAASSAASYAAHAASYAAYAAYAASSAASYAAYAASYAAHASSYEKKEIAYQNRVLNRLIKKAMK